MKNTRHKSNSKCQLDLIPGRTNQRFFGGVLQRGRRKAMRPLSKSEALHFVLRSQFGRGVHSFRNKHNLQTINLILDRAAHKYGVRIYRRAIQSNHIHLIFRISNRQMYRAFISVITGKIAQHVMQGMSFKDFLRTFLRGEGSTNEIKYNIPIRGQALLKTINFVFNLLIEKW